MYTQLKNRKLWYDGDSSYPASHLSNLIKQHRVKYIDKITDDVIEFNKRSAPKDKISVKADLGPGIPSSDWMESVESISLADLLTNILTKHDIITMGMSEDEILLRERRLAEEWILFTSTNYTTNMIKAIHYIVQTLTTNHQIWGVGRGSSVSSYILYIIGAHDVDSFKYDLSIYDFMPTQNSHK